MQVFNKNRLQANVVPDQEGAPHSQANEVDEAIENLEPLFGMGEDAEIEAPALTPFEALAAAMPSRHRASIDDFRPPKVPTVEEILMAKPELKFKIKSVILPAYEKGLAHFQKKIEQIEELLRLGGLRPQERIVLQDLKRQYENGVAEIMVQKQEADGRQAKLDNEYRQELLYRTDLNMDGYIGDPLDKENGFIVAKDRLGNDVILRHDRTVAFDPIYNENYMPAIASTKNMKRIDPANFDDPEKVPPERNKDMEKYPVDEVWEIKRSRDEGFPESPLGAQVHFNMTEGLWMKADKNGNLLMDKNYPNKGIPKEFEGVTREDGETFIGQKPPSPEERGKYIFVRNTDVDISSHPLDVKIPDANGIPQYADGGNVHLDLYNKVGGKRILLARIVVQGYKTDNLSPNKTDGFDWVMATTPGLAVTSGKKEDGTYTDNSSRISSINIDASRYKSTGKVLALDPQNREASIKEFYEEILGYASGQYDSETGAFIGASATDGVAVEDAATATRRGNRAANYTLRDGWLSTRPVSHVQEIKTNIRDHAAANGRAAPNLGGIESDTEAKEIAAANDIHGRFTGNGAEITTRSVYLPPEEQYDEFKTGMIALDLTGRIVGTNQSDLIRMAKHDFKKEDIRKYFPIGTENISSHHATYASVIDGGGDGRDILISNGGDVYAKNITFFKRSNSDDQEGALINVAVRDGLDNNQAYFLDIQDAQPGEVNIHTYQDNHDEFAKKAGVDAEEGIPEDWTQGPGKDSFKYSYKQNDAGKRRDPDIDPAIFELYNQASKELLDYIHRDPKTLANGFTKEDWNLPDWIVEEDESEGEFFEGYAALAGEEKDGWDNWVESMNRG